MSDRADLTEWTVVVGEIIAPHGIHGELQVRVYSEVKDRFQEGNELCLAPRGGGRKRVEIVSARPHRGGLLLEITDCGTRNEAELLRGAVLTVHPSMRPELPPGSYYQNDLIGLRVVTTAGEDIGTISDVLQTGSNDVYVTARALIPATREVVRSVDLARKEMTIAPVPGLLDQE